MITFFYVSPCTTCLGRVISYFGDKQGHSMTVTFGCIWSEHIYKQQMPDVVKAQRKPGFWLVNGPLPVWPDHPGEVSAFSLGSVYLPMAWAEEQGGVPWARIHGLAGGYPIAIYFPIPQLLKCWNTNMEPWCIGLSAYPLSATLQSQVWLEVALISPWEAPSIPFYDTPRCLWPPCPCFDHDSSASFCQCVLISRFTQFRELSWKLVLCSELLFGSWRWVGKGGMLFGAATNCTWLSCVLCQEALETFCASTDSRGM